jgi:hypothetical protein
LSPTNRAGLIAHEGIYYKLRFYGDHDSRRARKIVGHLFSGFPFQNLGEGIPEKFDYCHAYSPRDKYRYHFFMWSEGDKTKAQFFLIANQPVFSKKTAVFHVKYPFEVQNDGTNWGFGTETDSNYEPGDSVTLIFEKQFENNLLVVKPYIVFNDVDNSIRTDAAPIVCHHFGD